LIAGLEILRRSASSAISMHINRNVSRDHKGTGEKIDERQCAIAKAAAKINDQRNIDDPSRSIACLMSRRQ
jgi:hypothetical protein